MRSREVVVSDAYEDVRGAELGVSEVRQRRCCECNEGFDGGLSENCSVAANELRTAKRWSGGPT